MIKMASIRIILLMCIINYLFNAASILCIENKRIGPLHRYVIKKNSESYTTYAHITSTNCTKKKSSKFGSQMSDIFFKKTELLRNINTIPNKSFATAIALTIFTKNSNNLVQDPYRMLHLKSTTPSNIEFYYLEEEDLGQSISQFKQVNKSQLNFKQGNSSILQSQLSEKNPAKPVRERSKYKHEVLPPAEKKIDKYSQKEAIPDLSKTILGLLDNNVTNYALNKTTDEVKTLEKRTNITLTPTAYDRVKFFDIYDSDTYSPHLMFTNEHSDDNDKQKIILKEIIQNNNFNANTTSSRFVKKHINDKKYEGSLKYNKTNEDFFLSRFIDDLKVTESPSIENNKVLNMNHTARWSDFPFVAAYFYEPSKVRCDAAAISAHWLLSSAACLSKHHKDPKSDERSAYVVYCSESWRRPVRISYVQRSIIHPRFHLKDKARRHLYNVGAIQILNSMASTCSGWAPVALISHQVFGSNDGTNAIVVGWGLDRYDAGYLSQNNSKDTLVAYQNILYSKSCPGNFGFNKVKERDANIISNTYCVSLPPYSNKDMDTVRGGLLLMGGRLVALYLQEERRSSGEQTVLYTGIWRQIRWIFDVSSEPEDPEIFTFEM